MGANNLSREGFDFGSLLIGILSLLVGVIALRNPLASLASIVMYYGVFAILKGIVEIVLRNKVRKYHTSGNILLFTGIINIIFGLLLVFNVEIGMIVMPMVFAFWFLFDSIMGIFRARPIKEFSNSKYWLSIILSVLGIILGILLIDNPFASMFTLVSLVGFYFILLGIRYVVDAF